MYWYGYKNDVTVTAQRVSNVGNGNEIVSLTTEKNSKE